MAQAEGEAARFEQVLAEYAKAPAVTRDRLYLEAMEQVLGNSSKMMIDQKSGNSVMYLPLDQLLRNRAEAVARGLPHDSGAGAVPPSAIEGFSATGRASDRNSARNSRSGSN